MDESSGRPTVAPTAMGLSMVLCALALAGAAGCGGSPTAPSRDEVFYLHGGGVIDRNYGWEVYFPPLNVDKTQRVPRLVGVGVLDGDVRLSRPVDWTIRSADYTPQERFISYQSPRQFLFSIYERVDGPEEPWPDVLARFEASAKDHGSEILAARLPIATANAQGRSYLLRTGVPSKPDAYQAYTHEILVRSGQRVLLVQVVHPENIESLADEVAAVVRSMLVY
jgi:hypothetical protein